MRLRKSLFILFIVLSAFDLKGQKSMVVEGISFHYSIEDEYLKVELQAPTLGWVGLGFNQTNSIVHSDLLLFHVVDGAVEVKDMYVVDFGDPREDILMGGEMNVLDLSGYEDKTSTYLSFKLPMHSDDQYDFRHRTGKRYWLILAYSVADDFGHHSRVRKHVPIELSL